MLSVFEGKASSPPPIWLMRQAGRYLPEYRALRATKSGFLDLCYSPMDAATVTLQPIDRFDFDAAILFADILVVPHALGQSVTFVEGEGPRLEPIDTTQGLATLDPSRTDHHYGLICETVDRVRTALAPEKPLIGFCGAPWTVATYMVAGRGSPDQAAARLWAYRDPAGFSQLIDMLVDTSIEYLSQQIKAGVNLVQIFDTWAGNLPNTEFDQWSIAPTRRIVEALNKHHPTTPIIGFPRGAGPRAPRYVAQTKVNGLGCDTTLPLEMMAQQITNAGCVAQGNLDPLVLLAGGASLDQHIDQICTTMAQQPFIFNLGHGILPQTPITHVEQLVNRVREKSP